MAATANKTNATDEMIEEMPATADKRKGDGIHRLYYCEPICFYFLLLTFHLLLT
jgi:hypothetical protein